MHDLQPLLDSVLDADAKAFLAQAKAKLQADGANALPVLWAQLARRIGREPLSGARTDLEGGIVADLAAWRACDAAGLVLLQVTEVDDDLLVDLYLHGDLEEKTIVLRCLNLLPITAATLRLFGEVQRTNAAVHFEAGALDSNLVVRALREGGDDAGFTRDDFHRMVLKGAFLDLPSWRMFGALDEADPVLSEMLRDYATERESAGRSTWIDTDRFLGRAPVAGTVARLLGGLEHGDDSTRLAAAEGLLALGRADLAPYAKERLDREPREQVRTLLERIIARA